MRTHLLDVGDEVRPANDAFRIVCTSEGRDGLSGEIDAKDRPALALLAGASAEITPNVSFAAAKQSRMSFPNRSYWLGADYPGDRQRD